VVMVCVAGLGMAVSPYPVRAAEGSGGGTIVVPTPPQPQAGNAAGGEGGGKGGLNLRGLNGGEGGNADLKAKREALRQQLMSLPPAERKQKLQELKAQIAQQRSQTLDQKKG